MAIMSEFTPREIVSELDRFIVGQSDAKRAVALALRNRWRRKQLPDVLREEVTPKNILMIGPTGEGKAEAAAENRVLDALVGVSAQTSTRESFRAKLRAGDLDTKEIDIDMAD